MLIVITFKFSSIYFRNVAFNNLSRNRTLEFSEKAEILFHRVTLDLKSITDSERYLKINVFNDLIPDPVLRIEECYIPPRKDVTGGIKYGNPMLECWLYVSSDI